MTEPPDRFAIHETTVQHSQRVELVRRLSSDISRHVLAEMTDAELHEQWLFNCAYPGGVDHRP